MAKKISYGSYEIVVADGSDFDKDFGQFVVDGYRQAARLMTDLEDFMRNPTKYGVSVRGHAKREIYLVPSLRALEAGGTPAVLVDVDTNAETITPVRFLSPDQKHRWKDLESWAEKYLGI